MSLYPVTLAGLTFDGMPDGDGITWCWESLDGWHGAVARGSSLQPEAWPGEVAVAHAIGARSLVLAGFVGVPDGPTWWTAANTLEALVQGLIGYDDELVVHEPTPMGLQVRVAPGSRLTLSRRGELRVASGGGELTAGFTFSVGLVALDPFKYVV